MIGIKNKTIYLIFLTILLHIFFITFQPVNFEYVFYEGSNFIRENFNKEIASTFFKQQANTFFFTFIISFFSLVFPFLEPIYIGRLISILSYLFIGLSVINILNKSENKSNLDNFRSLFLILLFTNPIIWVFGYRSTPDLISMAISFYGFSLFYVNEEKKKRQDLFYLFIPSFLIGFATTIKPIVGIYLIASLSLMELKFTKNFFKKLFFIGLFYSIVPIIYFYFTYINFNFFLFTSYYKEVLSVVNNYSKYISNFVLYSSFLLICIFPIIIGRLFYMLKTLSFVSKFINLFLISLTFLIGNKYLSLSVEMSFGIFDKILSKDYLRGVFSIISYLFVFFIFVEFKKSILRKNTKNLNLLLVGILYLLIVASSLASQRYLITILPLFYFIFKDYCKSKLNYLFVLLICIPANVTLLGNQYLTGSLSFKLVEILDRENMLDKICVGAAGSHVSHYFTLEDRLPKNCVLKDFHIVNGIHSNSLYSVQDNFLFLNKSYSVIKVR